MLQASYSPLMLISAAGLMQNTGLTINPKLIQTIDKYTSFSTVQSYKSLLNLANEKELSDAIISDLKDFGIDLFPTLTNNSLPSVGSVAINDFGGLTNQTIAQAYTVMGNGNLGKFVQIFNAAQAYISQTNDILLSVINSNVLTDAFINTNTLITGNLADLSTDLKLFATDLENIGNLWNLRELEWIGYPGSLLRQMTKVAGLLPELVEILNTNGFSNNRISEIVRKVGPVDLQTEYELFRVLQKVTGSTLKQIKFILDIKTAGIDVLTDLLNPVKLFPNSYNTIRVRLVSMSGKTISVSVYLQDRSINSGLLNDFGKNLNFIDLSKVIPPDQALGTSALIRSLQQVKNIFSTDVPSLAITLKQVQNVDDLPIIAELSDPLPDSIKSELLGMLATGVKKTTLSVFDLIGSAAGYPFISLYNRVITVTDAMIKSGKFDGLTNPDSGVWTVMTNALNGEYDVEVPQPPTGTGTPEDPSVPQPPVTIIVIPSGLPGEGTYTTIDNAFSDGLIPAANDILITAKTEIPELSADSIRVVNEIADAISKEKNNFSLTGLNLSELAEENRSGLMLLAFSLHEFGNNDDLLKYFDAIADTSNIYGQSIAAALREGKNINVLSKIGIELDTQVPLLKTE